MVQMKAGDGHQDPCLSCDEGIDLSTGDGGAGATGWYDDDIPLFLFPEYRKERKKVKKKKKELKE